jgi:hypothetical protein
MLARHLGKVYVHEEPAVEVAAGEELLADVSENEEPDEGLNCQPEAAASWRRRRRTARNYSTRGLWT